MTVPLSSMNELDYKYILSYRFPSQDKSEQQRKYELISNSKLPISKANGFSSL